ncbi:H+ Antiporter protein [Piscirickettsia salmonis]|uniref:MFS transporter n=1 Tax=Piscirickettsia salmonis TaxID=1238 RepID=UPI0012BACE4E|nr:MFS transporter [Piscirickettsia salmonis]QGP55312.1 H+ Antiporter protein [Piscirickettsia salmonis]QGP58831.1 H+ Antiporter protein [Piscirickettsia salmonis]QGP64878.1 H+ Antiporter protein [Piscirickettsia salmonis]
MKSPPYILTNPLFRKLFCAQILATFGTGLSSIALAQLAYHLSDRHAGKILGIALVLKMVAYIFGAPLMSYFSAKIPNKSFMIIMDLIRVLLLASLFFVQSTWQIYLLIILINLCSAGFTPTFQALIPTLFQKKADYTKALSLSRMAYNLESLLSPLLAALLLFFVSFKLLFALNALTFLISSLLIYSTPLKSSNNTVQPRGFGCLYDYLTIKPLLQGLLFIFIAALAGAMVIVNTVVYIQGTYHLSESITALTMAVFGIASLITTVSIPTLSQYASSNKLMKCGALFCIGGFAIGILTPNLTGIFIIWFILGIGASLIETLIGLTITENITQEKQNNYFTAYFSLSHACWLSAYFITGWIGNQITMQNLLLLLFLISALLYLLATQIKSPTLAKP